MTLIDEYYKERGLKQPTALQAFMWLFTEVAELAFAEYTRSSRVREDPVGAEILRKSLNTIQFLSDGFEDHLGRVGGWVRNNERKVTRTGIESEAADIYMMLDRYLAALELKDPVSCLNDKMYRKLEEIRKTEENARHLG